MTRIIGLDLSLASTGIALPDGSTRTLKPRHVHPLGRRLNVLGTDLWNILEPHRPQLAVIEGHSLHSPGELGKLRRAEWVGCARRDLRRMRCEVVDVSPSTLKSYAARHGHASKADMVQAAQLAGGHPANDDEADAYLLWTLGRLVVDGIDLFNEPSDRARRLALADDLGWPDVEELLHAG